MADKVRFVLTSVSDTATLTHTSEVAGLPAENIQDQLIRKVYRTSGKSSEAIVFDCGGATSFNSFFLGRQQFSTIIRCLL